MNEAFRQDYLPDRNTEYFLYQTLVGAWPINLERLGSYMIKATREAKSHTSWMDPQARFEEALQKFVESLLSSQQFIGRLEAFIDGIRHAGYINSLTQTLLKITTPGIPDFYQGNELWDFSLVDPDNRRPVDYQLRRAVVEDLAHAAPEHLISNDKEGRAKFWVIRRALEARRRRPEWFGGTAAYRPLRPNGSKARHLFAFVRAENVAVLAPLFPLGLAGHWDDTTIELPEVQWRDNFTDANVRGGTRSVGELLGSFPVALLTSE
jgi:(1->4)-alpha-D-glucan 1-alpha-D-glucosylmutase